MNILIVRNSADKVNIGAYNLQEIGLAKALIKKGHNCDIVYYTTDKKIREEYIHFDGYKLKIYWCPAISIKGHAIYLKIMNRKFLEKYDIIQTAEYFQVMTYIIGKITSKPIVLYHGPYKDLNNKKLHKIYDMMFLKSIRRRVNAVISKSPLSTQYLKNKGFNNIYDLGVGVDISRFNNVKYNNEFEIIESLKKDGKKILLYIGRLDEEKNVKFLIDTLKNIKKQDNSIHLVIIGKKSRYSDIDYVDYSNQLGLSKNITYIDSVEQSKIHYLYEISDIFLLPSKYEIFGMVLLESMYFGKPVITSFNGGSSKLIDNETNGIIIKKFDENLWCEKILNLLSDKEKYKKISENARDTIVNKFTWDKLSEEYLQIYRKASKLN